MGITYRPTIVWLETHSFGLLGDRLPPAPVPVTVQVPSDGTDDPYILAYRARSILARKLSALCDESLSVNPQEDNPDLLSPNQ